ncbi:hypothetical protein LY625_03760 [Lysobacter sp. GX 14042]|uniref:hypothetical protein n=1 Tax=Lysobacter sp. GX 14042 TaxID=2907155 RepID=UPI001F393889|nr:hypothetical protein [Lysobacter sp. GX 14042]MCE7031740.1 hypothetical protein [Lysobacter sp. GX 14042]
MAIERNSEFAAAPGTEDGTLVGRNADTPVGFYGAAPIPRPVLPAATAEDIANALVALGLVSQAS